jgi:hypothetical protein
LARNPHDRAPPQCRSSSGRRNQTASLRRR